MMYQTFTDQATGTMEFWIYGIEGTSVRHDFLDIRFMSESLGVENFRLQADWDFREDDLIQYGTDDVIVGSGNFTSDTWHHLRVWWNCTSDKFKVWHNTDYMGEFDMRYTEFDNVDSIIFQTHPSDSKNDFYVYLDAIDYSWDSGYFTERSYDYYGNTYYSMGTWVSEAIDLEVESPYYEDLTVSCDTNENTSAALSYRMSADNSSWDSWSSWSTSNLSLAAYGKRYVQVRTLLNTSNTLQTPVLDWLSGTYRVYFRELLWNTTD